VPMRWDALFDDLEAQLGDALAAEQRDLGALRERQRQAALTLRDRLVELAHPPAGAFPVGLRGGGRLLVRPLTFGRDWFAAALPELPGDTQAIVPLAGLAGIHLPAVDDERQPAGRPEGADAARGRIRIADRIGLPIMLRDLARRRVPLDLMLPGEALHGTLDRVGPDHVELAVHDPDAPRRASAVVERRLVPLDIIAWVRL
jgi:hypothetical protein